VRFGNFGSAVPGPLYYKIHWKVITLVWVLHQPAGSLFYITGILSLLARWPQWIPRLAPLGSVGRMALTNYLVQSVTGTFLYYGYGFGLQTKLGNLAGLLLCVVVFAVQIFYSDWWLRRFQFGEPYRDCRRAHSLRGWTRWDDQVGIHRS